MNKVPKPNEAELADLRRQAAILTRRRDYEAAVETLARVVELAPDHAPSQLALGVTLQGARRHAEALRRFEAIDARAPERAAAVLHAAFSHLGLGDAVAAKRCAAEAIEAAPRSAAAFVALGQAELRLGRANAAERAFATALDIDTRAAGVWTLLSSARLMAGDSAGAEKALRRALAVNPDFVAARDALVVLETRGAGALTIWQPQDPHAALGVALDYLTRKATLGKLPFGEFGRTLVHQAGRGHHLFVVDGEKRVHGFLGWALTREALAREWMAGLKGLSDEECREGDCVIINAVAADSRLAMHVLVTEARRRFGGKKAIYFKRFYSDGRIRAMRLSVNAFVARHLARLMQSGSTLIPGDAAPPTL